MFDRRQIGNPEFFQTSSAGGPKFVEGNVRVTYSRYVVHKAQDPKPKKDSQGNEIPVPEEDKPKPHVALMWRGERLDERLNPIIEEDGPLVEDIYFGVGGKSLEYIHPGLASGPDAADDDIEDAGDEIGAEGPTVHVFNQEFKGPHAVSSFAVLMRSLAKANIHPSVEAFWAPSYEGMIVHMKSTETETVDGKEVFINEQTRTIKGKKTTVGTPYKVVTKIIEQPAMATKSTGKKGAKGAAKEAPVTQATPTSSSQKSGGGSAAGGGKIEELAYAAMIAIGNGGKFNGQKIARKALWSKFGEAFQGTEQQKNEAIGSFAKNDAWVSGLPGRIADDEQANFEMAVETNEDGKVSNVTFTTV